VKGFCVVVLMNGLVVEAAVVVTVVDGVVVVEDPVQEAVSGLTHLRVTGSKIKLFGHVER